MNNNLKNQNSENETGKQKKKLGIKAANKAKKEAKNFLGVGVDITNPKKPFKAYWYENGRKLHLGYFSTAQSAALAFNKKAKDCYTSASLAKKENRWNVIGKL